MVTVLINASIAWLCSLLVYELFLKRETFHRLNRVYLLLTFLAGLILPLLPWGQSIQLTELKTDMTGIPLILANPEAAAQEAAVQKAAGEATSAAITTSWWLAGYLAGAAIAVLFLFRDLLQLFILFRRARKTRSGRWLIAETGVAHSPFSFGHIIFACSRAQYTEQQWQMVLEHEQQHHKSRHILDMILMQLAAILLWFHPLVYIYRYKLRLLHEYEVDSLQQEDIQTYGRFLLEQAALKPAPVLTHSFSFSPLKNRIHMMTRTTSKRRVQYRLLLLLPMLGGFIYCCAQNKNKTEATIQNGRITKKGINITLEPATRPDTVYIEDVLTQELRVVVTSKEPAPLTMNGKAVLRDNTLSVAPVNKQTNALPGMKYIITHAGIEPILSRMPDGNYKCGISGVLIDETGHIVSYKLMLPALQRNPASGNAPALLPAEDISLLQEQLTNFLMGDDFTFTIELNSQDEPAPYQTAGGWDHYNTFSVRDHKVSYDQ